MTRFLVRRILWMIPVLFFVTLITFIIMHSTPGGPWDVSPDSRTSDPVLQAKLAKQYGLDLPWFINSPAAQEAMSAGKNPLEVTQAFFNAQFPVYYVETAARRSGAFLSFPGPAGERYSVHARSDGQAFLPKPLWHHRLPWVFWQWLLR